MGKLLRKDRPGRFMKDLWLGKDLGKDGGHFAPKFRRASIAESSQMFHKMTYSTDEPQVFPSPVKTSKEVKSP